MKCKVPLLFLAMCLGSSLSNAQQPPMSANTGLGPGNSFTLFVVFQNPMPNVQGISCAFSLQGATKPGQEDFVRTLNCSGAPVKDDDTHYRVKVGDIPQNIAEGNYKVETIGVGVDGVGHSYQGSALPNLAPVAVSNPKHLEFSPIKKLEIKQ